MAKTLKFALSALALVNGHKPRDDLQHAYDQFLKDFGKSYDSVEKQAGSEAEILSTAFRRRPQDTCTIYTFVTAQRLESPDFLSLAMFLMSKLV